MVLSCLEELDQLTGARVAALNEQIYQLQKQTVDGLINERLLKREAVRRGILTADYWKRKSRANGSGQRHGASIVLPSQGKEADLRERIRLHLYNQKLSARQSLFLGELWARANEEAQTAGDISRCSRFKRRAGWASDDRQIRRISLSILQRGAAHARPVTEQISRSGEASAQRFSH
jgi:hypothetical protein